MTPSQIAFTLSNRICDHRRLLNTVSDHERKAYHAGAIDALEGMSRTLAVGYGQEFLLQCHVRCPA